MGWEQFLAHEVMQFTKQQAGEWRRRERLCVRQVPKEDRQQAFNMIADGLLGAFVVLVHQSFKPTEALQDALVHNMKVKFKIYRDISLGNQMNEASTEGANDANSEDNGTSDANPGRSSDNITGNEEQQVPRDSGTLAADVAPGNVGDSVANNSNNEKGTNEAAN